MSETRQELYEIEAVFADMLDDWYSKNKEKLKGKCPSGHSLGIKKERIKDKLDKYFDILTNEFDYLAGYVDGILEKNEKCNN